MHSVADYAEMKSLEAMVEEPCAIDEYFSNYPQCMPPEDSEPAHAEDLDIMMPQCETILSKGNH